MRVAVIRCVLDTGRALRQEMYSTFELHCCPSIGAAVGAKAPGPERKTAPGPIAPSAEVHGHSQSTQLRHPHHPTICGGELGTFTHCKICSPTALHTRVHREAQCSGAGRTGQNACPSSLDPSSLDPQRLTWGFLIVELALDDVGKSLLFHWQKQRRILQSL